MNIGDQLWVKWPAIKGCCPNIIRFLKDSLILYLLPPDKFFRDVFLNFAVIFQFSFFIERRETCCHSVSISKNASVAASAFRTVC